MLDSSLTLAQATDLARYFLGPEWHAFHAGGRVELRRTNPDCTTLHIYDWTWRDVFRAADVKLPLRRRHIRRGQQVLLGDKLVCRAVSGTMAQRIAHALDEYEPGSKGY